MLLLSSVLGNNDSEFAVSNEVKKIALQSRHEKRLNTTFAWIGIVCLRYMNI